MTKADRVNSTPTTKAPVDYGDLEDTLQRAVQMSHIAVVLAERAFDVYAHYGDIAYHESKPARTSPYDTYVMSDLDVDALLFSLYEAHGRIREARDQYVDAETAGADNKAAAG